MAYCGPSMGASMCQLTVRCRGSFCSKRMMHLREDIWGRRKTLHKLQRTCYWAGMRKDIEDYVKGCVVCAAVKPSQQVPAGLLQTSTHTASAMGSHQY